AAIQAAGVLLIFFRVDVVTVSTLFRRPTAPRSYTFRDIFIVVLMTLTFILTALGFYVSRGPDIPHLSEDQMHALIKSASAMRTLFKHMPVATTNGEPETEPLAHDISSAFNRAGIEPMYVFTRPDNPDQTGVIVSIKDLNNPPPGTEQLQSALRSANLD